MLKEPDNQGSFFDASCLCERLIPPDSFYRKFKEVVALLCRRTMMKRDAMGTSVH